MKFLSLLKRLLPPQKAPQDVNTPINESLGVPGPKFASEADIAPPGYRSESEEDWSGNTKLLAAQLMISPAWAQEHQEEIDIRHADLDCFDRRVYLDRTRQELKKRLMLEVSQTVDRVFEETRGK